MVNLSTWRFHSSLEVAMLFSPSDWLKLWYLIIPNIKKARCDGWHSARRVLEYVSMVKSHAISMCLESLTNRNCWLYPDDFWRWGSVSTFSGSKPVAGKIGNLMLKQTACAPSLGLPFAVKLSSLKVSTLFQSNFPLTAVTILFPLSCHLQQGRGKWSPLSDTEMCYYSLGDLKHNQLRNVSKRLQWFGN